MGCGTRLIVDGKNCKKFFPFFLCPLMYNLDFAVLVNKFNLHFIEVEFGFCCIIFLYLFIFI